MKLILLHCFYLLASTFLFSWLFWLFKAQLSVDQEASEDVYTIAFHTCALQVASIDVDIRLEEVNPGPDHLGAGLVRK